MFEQTVEFAAVQSTPGTVKVVSRLRLLPGVVVVQELVRNRSQNYYKGTERFNPPLMKILTGSQKCYQLEGSGTSMSQAQNSAYNCKMCT